MFIYWLNWGYFLKVFPPVMATHASALVGEETVKLLRVDQVAEMLAVSETTVRTLLRNGAIPYVEIGSNAKRKTIRVKEAEVEAYVERQTRTGTKQTVRRKQPKSLVNRY